MPRPVWDCAYCGQTGKLPPGWSPEGYPCPDCGEPVVVR